MHVSLRAVRLCSAAGIATLLGLLSAAAAGPAPPLLARIDVPESLSSFPLPVYAQLRDAAGQDYVLVQADLADLEPSGWRFQPLDAPAAAADYVLAHEFRPGARAAAAQGPFQISTTMAGASSSDRPRPATTSKRWAGSVSSAAAFRPRR